MIVLKASDLAKKSGFSDGDLISNLLSDLEEDAAHVGLEDRVALLDASADETDEGGYPGHTGDHKVLIALVRKHLAPLLPGVALVDASSSHNPIRARREAEAFCAASSISVQLAIDDVLEVVIALEAEVESLSLPAP